MQTFGKYAVLLLLIFVAGCKKEDDLENNNNTNTNNNNNNWNNNNSNNPPPPSCNDSLLPIVMMHGFLASGDTYAKHYMLFTSNGYCGNRLFAYDWNTLGLGGGDVNVLDAFIDSVLAQTGASQINLFGHSAGGGLGYNYLSDATRAAKVAHYVHIASSTQSGAAGPNGEIPTLNLWSDGDEVVSGADITGVTNVMIPGIDHYQVATSVESFEEIYKFLNNGEVPQTLTITQETVPCISGKTLAFGENTPSTGATVRIFKVNTATGERQSASPDTTFTTDASGSWGPFPTQLNAYYEFEVSNPAVTNRVVHYYREPFVRTHPLVYLRTLPPATSLAGLLLSSLPEDDNQTALIIFSSNQAVIDTRDELSVDGFELSTSQYAAASKTSIAFFLFDDDGDGQTSGNTIAAFNLLNQFLAGVDVFFPTTPPGTISLEFNGRTMNVRNWRSGSDGVTVPVFD